jgi:hypothetical protein
LRYAVQNYLNNVKTNNYPLYIFNLNVPRASDFLFRGSMEENLLTSIIEEYFINRHGLVYKIKDTDPLYIFCNVVKNIYEKYGDISLGNDGHIIIENHFMHKFKSKDIFPFVCELPVWKVVDPFTGHIDLVALYYREDRLYFLILDFKPYGKAQILRAIPQLTAYGYLFRITLERQFIHLGLNLSSNNFSIICIGFDHEIMYGFDPFSTYKYIQSFIEYEYQLSKRCKSIILDKENFSKLVSFTGFF